MDLRAKRSLEVSDLEDDDGNVGSDPPCVHGQVGTPWGKTSRHGALRRYCATFGGSRATPALIERLERIENFVRGVAPDARSTLLPRTLLQTRDSP